MELREIIRAAKAISGEKEVLVATVDEVIQNQINNLASFRDYKDVGNKNDKYLNG
jgi:hypothetical protein